MAPRAPGERRGRRSKALGCSIWLCLIYAILVYRSLCIYSFCLFCYHFQISTVSSYFSFFLSRFLVAPGASSRSPRGGALAAPPCPAARRRRRPSDTAV